MHERTDLLKKAVIIFLSVAVVLIFFACTANNNDSDESLKTNDFASSVRFSEEEHEIVGTIKCAPDGEIQFTISEPENIKGIVLKATETETSLGFQDFSIPLKQKGEPKGMETIFEVLFSLFRNEPKRVRKAQYIAKYPSGEAVITCDDNGYIKNVRAGEYDFVFTSLSESA